MSRAVSILVALLAVTSLAIGGWIVWSQVEELQTLVAETRNRVVELRSQLESTEERSRQAERRADAAEEEAAQNRELAQRLAERAEAAERAAADAQEVASAASSEAAEAAAARQTAEKERQETMLRAQEAFLEAEKAKREVREARQRREQDLDRLARALDQIAETRRNALGVVTNLGDGIEFDFDRAELRPGNRELLARIAGVLMTAEDFSIQVLGHTDDVGSVEYNQKLSQKRAQTVRDYLVGAGIDPEAISALGLGKSSPLVEGTDDRARQRNRRVEIALVHSSGEVPEGEILVEHGSP